MFEKTDFSDVGSNRTHYGKSFKNKSDGIKKRCASTFGIQLYFHFKINNKHLRCIQKGVCELDIHGFVTCVLVKMCNLVTVHT